MWYRVLGANLFHFLSLNFFQPQNLLLDSGPLPKVKIIDFGCAAEISDSEPVVKQVFGNPECSGKCSHFVCSVRAIQLFSST